MEGKEGKEGGKGREGRNPHLFQSLLLLCLCEVITFKILHKISSVLCLFSVCVVGGWWVWVVGCVRLLYNYWLQLSYIEPSSNMQQLVEASLVNTTAPAHTKLHPFGQYCFSNMMPRY